VSLVRTERRRAAEVDECPPPRGESLGIAEYEAGVVPGGQNVYEAGGAGLGLGTQPPVPVAPPGVSNTYQVWNTGIGGRGAYCEG